MSQLSNRSQSGGATGGADRQLRAKLSEPVVGRGLWEHQLSHLALPRAFSALGSMLRGFVQDGL